MSLMIADIDESATGDVAASLPGSVAVAADVSSADGAEAYVSAAVDRYGRIDGALLNAGIAGYVDTRLVDNAETYVAAGGDTGEVRAAFEGTVALGRYSTPDEQAALVAWLLSAESSYATGGAFPFDGGLSAGPYSTPAP